MSTRSELLALLSEQGMEVGHHSDNSRGIPSCLLRHREAGAYVVTIGGDLALKDQVGALVDGLAWIASETSGPAHLVLRVGKSDIPSATSGVLGALGSAAAHYSGQVHIQIETEDLPGHFVHDSNPLMSVEADKKLARWTGYLESWYATSPTGLARDILDREKSNSLRLYPQLSKNPAKAGWSLRLDGLQVGVVNNDSGWLRVGKSLTPQKAVQAWGQVRPGGYGTEPLSASAEGATKASTLIQQLVDLLGVKGGLVDHRQPEHSLESAILRGVVPVFADETRLGLPRETDGRQQRIAWGSQVPTLWWHGGSARYLDALMKDGTTPWAVEIKVAKAGGGYGRLPSPGTNPSHPLPALPSRGAPVRGVVHEPRDGPLGLPGRPALPAADSTSRGQGGAQAGGTGPVVQGLRRDSHPR